MSAKNILFSWYQSFLKIPLSTNTEKFRNQAEKEHILMVKISILEFKQWLLEGKISQKILSSLKIYL